MATCREIFTFSWPLRGRGGGVNPSGQPDRFFTVFFLTLPLLRPPNRMNFWVFPCKVIIRCCYRGYKQLIRKTCQLFSYAIVLVVWFSPFICFFELNIRPFYYITSVHIVILLSSFRDWLSVSEWQENLTAWHSSPWETFLHLSSLKSLHFDHYGHYCHHLFGHCQQSKYNREWQENLAAWNSQWDPPVVIVVVITIIVIVTNHSHRHHYHRHRSLSSSSS